MCGASPSLAGEVIGKVAGRRFRLARCVSCGYAFVVDPERDFSQIYTPAYYRGEGADPLVDYLYELEHPAKTIRAYEWRGVVTLVRALIDVREPLLWLDFGCGNGAFVRHCREVEGIDALGYDKGWIVGHATADGIPILNDGELERLTGKFDVVTAIEVLEHVSEPVEALRTMRRLLRPGGLLFLTTGNAEPHSQRLTKWSYVLPEIHVSYFEPRTLAVALRKAGLRPDFRGMLPGHPDIIKFKVLKNLHVRRRSLFTDLLPSKSLAAVADHRAKVTAHPIGWAV